MKMKINFKLSSKMHLFIIISCIVMAIGLAVGLSCQFAADGYFNYGADWSSYKSVTVSYEYVDFPTEDKVVEMCDKAFDEAGINGYSKTFGKTSTGGEIVYKFTQSTDDTKLDNAVLLIQSAIKEQGTTSGGITISSASGHNDEGLLGGGKVLAMCAIALASIAAFHFLYFVVRYKLTMAFAALLADVHNLAIYLSLLAILRIPVGTAMFAFAAVTLLITVIGTCFTFDKMRKNFKDEEFKKLPVFEQVDKCADECFAINTILPASLAVVAVLLFVLMSISSLSPLAIISPVLCALVSFASYVYGTAFFTPSVYSRFKQIGDDFKKKHARAPKEKASK